MVSADNFALTPQSKLRIHMRLHALTKKSPQDRDSYSYRQMSVIPSQNEYAGNKLFPQDAGLLHCWHSLSGFAAVFNVLPGTL